MSKAVAAFETADCRNPPNRDLSTGISHISIMALLVPVQAMMYGPSSNAIYGPYCMLNQVVRIGDSLFVIPCCLQVVNHCMNVNVTLRLRQLKKGFVNVGLGFEDCKVNN